MSANADNGEKTGAPHPGLKPMVGRKYGAGSPPPRTRPVPSVGRQARVHYDEHGRKIKR